MKGQMEWHDMIVVFTEQERVRSTLVYPFFSFAWPTHFVQICTCESVWHCHLPAKGKCRGKSWLLIAMSSNSAPKTCSIDSSCCEFPLAHPFRKKAFCLAFMQPLSTELSKNTCLIWRHLVLYGIIYTYISGPIALDTVPFMAEYGRIKRPTGWSFWVKPMVPPCPRNFNRWDSWWHAIGLASRVPLRCPSLRWPWWTQLALVFRISRVNWIRLVLRVKVLGTLTSEWSKMNDPFWICPRFLQKHCKRPLSKQDIARNLELDWGRQSELRSKVLRSTHPWQWYLCLLTVLNVSSLEKFEIAPKVYTVSKFSGQSQAIVKLNCLEGKALPWPHCLAPLCHAAMLRSGICRAPLRRCEECRKICCRTSFTGDTLQAFVTNFCRKVESISDLS